MEEAKQKEILENNLHTKLEKRKPSIDAVLSSIEKEGKELTDFLVPSKGVWFETNGSLKVFGMDDTGFYFHEHALSQYSDKMNVPPRQEIDMKEQIKRLPQVGLNKDEASLTEEKLLSNNPADGVQGKNTMLKLVNAITSTANSVSGERKRELQEIASSL